MPYSRSRSFVSKSEAVSREAMVTAMHPLAAEAGVEILTAAGGNAADAAIATALALGVVEPFMSGLGGCAYAVAFDARRQLAKSFDGSAVVPAGASADMFALALAPGVGLYGFRRTKDGASETGLRSIAVPGALAALDSLHAFMGTLPWSDLVAPAARLAREGFLVDEYVFVQTASSAARLRPFPQTLDVFFNEDGTPKVPGSHDSVAQRLRQPALAASLELLGREGPRAFYSGSAAREMARFVRERGGLLSVDDLARYQAREAPPTSVRYRGRRVETLPGASGGPTLAMALERLDGVEVARHERSTAARVDLIAQTLHAAFAERFRSLADDSEHQHTTHVNVVDRDRNMVSLTATLGARYGSGVTVPALGVVLNNGMMWFDPEPGRRNSIRPGKRALHAAAPTLVFEDDRPRLALGAPGARRIMSALLQVLVGVLDDELGIQGAIEAPRVHCEADETLEMDARFPEELREALADRYRIVVRSDSFMSSYFGRPSGILVDGDGPLHGGVEPYRSAVAIGY